MKLSHALCAAFVSYVAASANGQAISYHHRSTAEGDVTSARAERVRAEGEAVRAKAKGYEAWISGEHRRLHMEYEYYQMKQQIERDRAETKKRKYNDHRQRVAEKMAQADDAARALLNEVQLDAYAWPAALRQPQYCSSLQLLESILKNWGQGPSTSDYYARRALMTEAALLRRQVIADKRLSYASRHQAATTLKLVQRLPMIDVATTSTAVAIVERR